MNILIAPDKFKGSLTAEQVAGALTRAARRVHPEASFTIRPIADGGEGTVEAFLTAAGGRVRQHGVSGPLGETVQAEIALLYNDETIIEMASASGLSLVEPSPVTASDAHTFGTGQLLRAAADTARGRVVLGVGGSASTDGGSGAARAWGWRFLDSAGAEVSLGGAGLIRLAHIEPPQHRTTVDVIGACDVDNPLLGPRGAARVFAAQKGADAAVISRLEEGLHRLSEVIASDVGIDVSSITYGGAGGGMGAGLVAFFGASLTSGLQLLADATSLEEAITVADLVVTGEGRLDSSSLGGKAPIAVARMAQRHRKPCIAIVGDLQVDRSELKSKGIENAIGIRQTGGADLADSDPEGAIEKALVSVLRHRQEKKKGRSMRS